MCNKKISDGMKLTGKRKYTNSEYSNTVIMVYKTVVSFV